MHQPAYARSHCAAPRDAYQRSVARVFPFQTLLLADATGLRVTSKGQAEQVRSVSVERVGAVLGRVPADLMAELDDALRLHLQL